MSKRLNTLEFRLYSGFFRPIFVPVVFTTNDQLKLVKMASGSGRPRAVPSKIPLFRLKWIEEPATSFKISISNTCASSKEKSNRKWKYCECRSRCSKILFHRYIGYRSIQLLFKFIKNGNFQSKSSALFVNVRPFKVLEAANSARRKEISLICSLQLADVSRVFFLTKSTIQ